jgi:hypothetical protein
MQYMKARKLATGMLVAFLLLSSLALLPSVTVKAASAGSAILSFNVVDNTNTPVAGATATLTETHTSKVYTNTTDASGLVTFSPLPGYYILKISKTGFFDLEYGSVVKFDGITSVTLGLVQIANLPAGTGTLALSVTRTVGGAPVVGSLKVIDLNSPTRMEKTYAFSGTLNLPLYPSNYRLVISGNGLETDVRDITIANTVTNTQNVALDPAVVLNGFVYKAGAPGTAVKAVLVSTNTALVPEKRIIQARVTSNYFEFDAFAGTFTLMVDSADSMTDMSTVTLSTPQTLTVNLNAQNVQTDTSNVVFGTTGWNWFNLTHNIAMDFDASWPNIAYSFIPNLRMQIDFAFGAGDGTVSAADYNLFLNKVRSFGPANVTSDYIVKVNGTKYAVNQDFTSSGFTGLSGISVIAVTGYTGTFVTPYKSLSTLTDNLSIYTVQGYVKYDTNSLNYKTVLTWPSTYEMTANTTQTSFVKVTGYLSVSLDALFRTTGSASFEQVTMTVQKSTAPTAVGGVQVPSTYAYAVTSGSNVLHYIVSTQRNIVFTGNGSSDPNGNPLKYTWAFGDGQRAENVSTAWTSHNYSAAAFNLTVVLRVYDVAGLSASKTFFIKTDGIVPIPDFTVQNHKVASPMLVNQTEALVFNGASSVDHIASTSDVGVIKTWTYVWGDGNVTTIGVGENQNVTKTYARAGTFTMMLNVTDAAGHVSTKSIQVIVKDKTPPEVSFVIQRNGVNVLTALENQTLVLTANTTHDVNDTFGSLNFTWSFGDGKTGYGAWVRHNFSAIKIFTVKLSVRDVAGNVKNLSQSLTITSSVRPDLRIVSMVFSPTIFTEGDRGLIKVNISNVGNDVAQLPHLEFYYLDANGKAVFIGNETAFTVNGSAATELRPGQNGLFSFGWTPGSRGNYTVKVVAVVDREVNDKDNSDVGTITVNEAAWKPVALYGGIFVVIVVVIVLFYMRRRLPKIGKSGGKKSEAKEPQKGKK